MTRSSSRRSAESLPAKARVTRAHLKKQSPKPEDNTSLNPIDLKIGIAANWSLSSRDIRTSVPSQHWPLDEPDPECWPFEIIHLLHKVSELTKGHNDVFQQVLKEEIVARQRKNKSARGKTECITAPDLKKVCRRLQDMAQEKEVTEKAAEQKDIDTQLLVREKIDVASQKLQPRKTQAAKNLLRAKGEKLPVPQGESKPNNHARGQPKVSSPKRTASDLPLRPARKTRANKSPNPKSTIPPPKTPANPPEASDEEDEEQENAPPEPVSGRHIYGDYIPPVAIEFNPEDAAAAQSQPQGRQTRSRKRARADEEKEVEEEPVEVQIDSDPRDIDATGFLSELDPKEARRRRKPRLSRLQAEPVAEPAWSQDVVSLDTPIATPAAEARVDELPAVTRDYVATPVAGVNGGSGLEDVLVDLLPLIPENATDEERGLLANRLMLLKRDVAEYQRCVEEIEEREVRKEGIKR